MANHKHAKKCIRKIKTRTAINKNRKSLMRTALKKSQAALKVKDFNVEDASKKFIEAQKQLMRAAQKKVISKKSASRKVSKLNLKLKSLSA